MNNISRSDSVRKHFADPEVQSPVRQESTDSKPKAKKKPAKRKAKKKATRKSS
jgi:hypothetical protein